MENITLFREVNFIYSNFYLSSTYARGLRYRHSEGVFQSYKTNNYSSVVQMCSEKPKDAKYLGKRVTLVPNWEEIKYDVMYQTVLKKFLQNDFLKERLLDTGDVHIEEGNNHGDTIWGTVNGVGQNLLGKAIMQARSFIRSKIAIGDFNTLDIIRNVDIITSNYNRIKYLLSQTNKLPLIMDGELMLIAFAINKSGFSFRYSFIDCAQCLNDLTADTNLKVLSKLKYEFNPQNVNIDCSDDNHETLHFPELNLDTLEYSGSIILDRDKVIQFIKDLLEVYEYDTSTF